MTHSPRVIIENACYHLIARGNQKRMVFHDQEDYQEFIERLMHYKKKYGFKLYAYCFMPNHIHMIGQIEDDSTLSKFMQGLLLSYAIYFNQRHEGAGHIWQGRFKNKVLNKDQYLIDCISYIESNPIKAELVKYPYEYPWSSYRERALDKKGKLRLVDELQF
jgi:putative transposase